MQKGALQFCSDSSDKNIIIPKVKQTETIVERTQGLLGKPPLGEDEALWIIPCNSIHTIGMKYSLDIIYVNRSGKVEKIIENILPLRASFCLSAHSTIELKAGAVAKTGIRVGHTIQWIEKKT